MTVRCMQRLFLYIVTLGLAFLAFWIPKDGFLDLTFNSRPGHVIKSRYTSHSHHGNRTPHNDPGGVENAKVILTWNSFYTMTTFGASGFGKKAFQNCSVTNCFFTNNRKYLARSSAILIHVAQIRQLPVRRDPKQLYVYFLRESPAYPIGQKGLKYKWNLTMTYRLDSDIPVPVQEIYKSNKAQVSSMKAQVSPYKLKFPFAERTRDVAWVVSHCDTKSNRERYVRELKRYIDVDIFGKCGNTTYCTRADKDCLTNKIPRTYKFYLGFENALCQDYVTEKLFRPLSTEILPIVYGGTNYSRDAPPHSFINVADYSSPKELARYLRHLSANESEYTSYFQWRNIYAVWDKTPILQIGICKLCEIVNTPNFHKTYSVADITAWWSTKKCKSPPFLHGWGH